MKRKRLTAEQQIAIGYLSQPKNGGKTYAEIAKECGVSERTIYNWLNDEYFNAELRKKTKMNVSKYVPDVVDAMVKASMKDGNAAAAKLILTMAEMLTEKHEVNMKGEYELPTVEELRRMVREYDRETGETEKD